MLYHRFIVLVPEKGEDEADKLNYCCVVGSVLFTFSIKIKSVLTRSFSPVFGLDSLN